MNEADMVERLKNAVFEYVSKRNRYIELRANMDGYYRPPSNDTCPLCEGAMWSSKRGAHLKTSKHIALKWRVSERSLLRNVLRLEVMQHKDIAYKSLSWNTDTWRLCSPSYANFIWEPGVVMASQCNSCADGPELHCGCGLYVYWNASDAKGYQSGNIVAELKIGGTVVECQLGARAQYATIIGIVNQGQEIDYQMAEVYGVPVVTGDPFEDFIVEV